MDFSSRPDTSPVTLALYGAAVAIALGAAALASTTAFTPSPADQPQPQLVVTSQPQPDRPDRIAGLIEPTQPLAAVAAAEPIVAIAAPARQALVTTADKAAAIPPKPVPRPCLECPAPVRAAAAPTPALTPAADEFAVAEAAAMNGPVPPMPVGSATDGEGDRPGLLMRGGRAVVAGGSEIVGTAWNLSGQAVGGLVRGVRDLTF